MAACGQAARLNRLRTHHTFASITEGRGTKECGSWGAKRIAIRMTQRQRPWPLLPLTGRAAHAVEALLTHALAAPWRLWRSRTIRRRRHDDEKSEAFFTGHTDWVSGCVRPVRVSRRGRESGEFPAGEHHGERLRGHVARMAGEAGTGACMWRLVAPVVSPTRLPAPIEAGERRSASAHAVGRASRPPPVVKAPSPLRLAGALHRRLTVPGSCDDDGALGAALWSLNFPAFG